LQADLLGGHNADGGISFSKDIELPRLRIEVWFYIARSRSMPVAWVPLRFCS